MFEIKVMDRDELRVIMDVCKEHNIRFEVRTGYVYDREGWLDKIIHEICFFSLEDMKNVINWTKDR